MPHKDPEVAREYRRQQYLANRDAIKARTAAYQKADPARTAAYSRQWRAKNPEARSEVNQRYNTANAEKMKAIRAAWVDANPDKKAAIDARYRRSNPDAVRAKSSRRRAAERAAVPTWFGELDSLVAAEAAHLALLRAQSLGGAWHIDHVVPLRGEAVCGLHVWNNLAVIPAATNLRKRNQFSPQ